MYRFFLINKNCNFFEQITARASLVNELIFGACHTCLRNVTKKNHHSPFGKLRTPIIRFAVINIGRMDPLRKWAKLSVVLDGTRNFGYICSILYSEEVTHGLGKLRRCPMREKKQKVFKRPAVKCG